MSMPSFQFASYERPVHILVVEDNKLNQQVIREILLKTGARIHLANNGIEALNFLNNTDIHIDAVLMDIQMPEMDGLTATRHIRAIPQFSQLPIIALTANALPSDREQCLAVGMNEHVAKPVDFNVLFKVLRHFIHPEIAADVQESPAKREDDALDSTGELAVTSVTSVLFDIDDLLRRINNNQPLVETLMRSFIKENDHSMAQIGIALEQEHLDEAQRLVHTLKGVSGNLSLMALHANTEQLDKVLKNADLVEARALFVSTQSCFTDTCQAINHFLLGADKPAATPVSAPVESDNEQIRLQMQALYQLLLKNNMRSKRQFDEMKAALLEVSSQAAEIQGIEEALRKLAFKQAVPYVEALAAKLGIELLG